MKHQTLELLALLKIEPSALNIQCREQIERYEWLAELTGNQPHYNVLLTIISAHPLPERTAADPEPEGEDDVDVDADGEIVTDEVNEIFDGPSEVVKPKGKKNGKRELVTA